MRCTDLRNADLYWAIMFRADLTHAEHDRLQVVLEAYEARAVADSIPDDHAGLRQRVAALALKLTEKDVA